MYVYNVLQQILADKRGEVERAREARPIAQLKALPGYRQPRRNFYGAVAAPRERPNLIAEIKRASPSAGVIRTDFDVAALAAAYERGGAAALSVLTDRRHFGGDPAFIAAAKQATGLPVLRKDFIVDPWQLHEARALEADAVLLIAEALPTADLAQFARLALELELCILLEVHSRETLLAALGAVSPENHRGGLLLGINNRDLARQSVDLATTEALSALAPASVPLIAESGIRTRADVQRMMRCGVRGLLVGEALMRQADVERATRELLGE